MRGRGMGTSCPGPVDEIARRRKLSSLFATVDILGWSAVGHWEGVCV